MAFAVPETLASHDGRVTPGERKVFVALRDHLPEDYLVYYDIPVDGRHPDFIIVGPELGLVIMEVKDCRLNGIAEVTGRRGPSPPPNHLTPAKDAASAGQVPGSWLWHHPWTSKTPTSDA